MLTHMQANVLNVLKEGRVLLRNHKHLNLYSMFKRGMVLMTSQFYWFILSTLFSKKNISLVSHPFESILMTKAIKIPSWVQKLRPFYWKGGFGLLVGEGVSGHCLIWPSGMLPPKLRHILGCLTFKKQCFIKKLTLCRSNHFLKIQWEIIFLTF